MENFSEQNIGQANNSQPAPKQSRKIPSWIGFVIIVAVALILFGGVFAYQYLFVKPQQGIATSPLLILSESKATDLAVDALIDTKRTSLSKDCLSTLIDSRNGNTLSIGVLEKHGGECGGDPASAPRVATVEVNLQNGQVSMWDYFEDRFIVISGEPEQADQIAGWKTYTNTEYGFEIKYPAKWGFSNNVSQLTPSLAFCPPGLINSASMENNCSIARYENGHLKFEGEKFAYFFGVDAIQNFGDNRYNYLGFNNSLYYYLYFDTENFPVYKFMVSQVISTFKFTNPSTSNLTSGQIFQEVSAWQGFHIKLSYFRIFGQDKVQYSFGSGATFAYKAGGRWYMADKGGYQDLAECSEYATVPAQYNPGCVDVATGKTKYIDSNGQSINYPPSQMVSYIGE